jgi:anthranilate phosphoribosyltransferase
MGQLLDGRCADLQTGAFCIAMRLKGETPAELAGFLDALHARLTKPPRADRPVVVLPCYNGARKLPALTPLLALMLARQGLPVLVHGTPTESGRVGSREVLALLGVQPQPATQALSNGSVHFVPTESLHPGLKRLLDVRHALGLRNAAHSLVKLMNPVNGPALVVGSYTHPHYGESMAAACELTATHAMLLRGTEGEPVAHPRRTPRMRVSLGGATHLVQPEQSGPLVSLPALPTQIDAASTARYIRSVLAGELQTPKPIRLQAEHIARACEAIAAASDPSYQQRLAA